MTPTNRPKVCFFLEDIKGEHENQPRYIVGYIKLQAIEVTPGSVLIELKSDFLIVFELFYVMFFKNNLSGCKKWAMPSL